MKIDNMSIIIQKLKLIEIGMILMICSLKLKILLLEFLTHIFI